MPKRKKKNLNSGQAGPTVAKKKRTDEVSHQDIAHASDDNRSPVTDPSILHDKRVLLVQQLHLESVLPGVTPFLQYPEVDTINAESSRGGRIGKLIDYLQRRVVGKSYEAFNVLMKMIAGCQPELFEELTDRAPTQSETLYCIKCFEREVKECIKDKGHTTDSPLDEKINLESEHMQLTIVKDPPSSDIIENLPDKYQSHLAEVQKKGSNISALEVLDNDEKGNKPQMVSLYGPAGIGKSTTMQWLARQWAKNKWASEFPLLFLLQLRMLAVSDCSMTAIELLTLHGLFQIMRTDSVAVLSSWLKNSAGKIIICIDGLDEVAGFRTRLRDCPKISDLNQRAHPIDLCLNILRGDLLTGCTIVTASRPFSALGELNFDKQFEILGLTEDHVVKFVECKHPTRADYIISYLRGNPILMSICGITFYCGLISSLLAEGVVFANDDLKTYTRLIAFIIVQCVTRKISDWPFVLEVGSYFHKLSKMAYMGIFDKLLKGEMSKIVFNEFDMSKVELTPQELTSIQRAGLLQMKKVKTGLIHSVIAEFFHLSVQEVLASAYLLSNPISSDNILKQLFSEGQFNMSLLYLFGLQFDGKSPCIKSIMSSANRSEQYIGFDVMEQIDHFLDDLCKQCRLRGEFTNRLQICQLLYEGQMEAKARIMDREIAPDGKLHIHSTPMTIIDLMAVRFACQYSNMLNEILISSSHFTCSQIQFLTSSLLTDHAETLHTLEISYNDLADGGMKAIGDFLKQNHGLQSLKINEGEMNVAGVVAIAEGLHQNNRLQKLELRRCNVRDAGAKALAELLRHNNTMKTLNVYGNKIGQIGGKALAESLHQNTGLLKLNIGNNGIGPIGEYGQALQHNRTLETLNVNENEILTEGVSALAAALYKNDTLKRLDITDNQIGDKGAETLAKALECNDTLQELDVSSNNIGKDGALALAQALQQCKSLRVLNFRSNAIGNTGGNTFAAVLQNNETLQTLNLSHTNIGHDSAMSIAEALHGNTSLLSLSLRQNAIGKTGAKAIAEALKHNANINALDVSLNEITNTGAKDFAEALQENRTLQSLTVGSTTIDCEGITALSEALSHNNTLHSLDLSRSKIGDRGANALAKALRLNRNLQTLKLASCHVGQPGVIALCTALQSNKTLQTLNLSGTYIVDTAANAVAEAFSHNSTLQTLKIGLRRKLGEDTRKALSEVAERDTSGAWHPLKRK